MKKTIKFLGYVLLGIAGLAVAAYAAAWGIAKYRYEKKWLAHEVDFPIPFPLGEVELEVLRAERVAAGESADDPLAGIDVGALALERAVARGERLVATRTGCSGCHEKDFGGRALVDEWIIGRWAAPNLTTGKGSVTADYRPSDWDHAVRHGLRHNGRTSAMPTVEFANLSDRELSDIAAYIRSKPAVDRESGTTRYGPILAYVFAGKPDFVAAFDIDHQKPHAREPPMAGVTAEFGQHLVQVCTGCHGPGLSGGKIDGDPDGTVYPNLTPHETGLGAWTEADFLRAIRAGRRKDGSAISAEMPWKAYAGMSDEELKAIYAYLASLPPRPLGNR
jgi:mono/diheme cytochrome c family protein